ncbi:MAG: hypothetical protein JO021_06130 [Alphaproteobacteria bacterium]|nr:hypothetical protein [Alphaproteobacteria bacterium]
MMRFLRTLALNRAAKRYARELPGQLRRSYGGAKRYTPAQIRRAVADAGLDEQYAGLAYAGHLTEDEFRPLGIKMPNGISYTEARALLAHYGPLTGFSSDANPEDSGMAQGGGDQGGQWT